MELLPPDRYGFDFIPPEFIPAGRDEYWLRNSQQPPRPWRRLASGEIETLAKNGNHCQDWNTVLVSDPFDADLIRSSNFYGLVRIGPLVPLLLKHHDFCVPAGIRASTIVSCDIGGGTAIQDCSGISHYIIGDNCILSNIGEMQTTNHSKFGNGAIKDGEDEDVRVWIDVMNEAGGRSILPFDRMIPADAFLWAAYRDDTELTEQLKAITQREYGGFRGRYGTIGRGTVIKSCAIIKDTAVGECAYIKGANKLKNLTILSSEEEPAQIGEGVELVNGIVGYACHVFYGSKAVRFVMGRNCGLKYGARLIHSVLGDNSTVSCCEMLNNLVFPVHEQHHNNSFLIACLIQGQSNMAAAATIGSNHNSRANDGEIRAGRGFWPGLAVSLKHSSCFASFVIIAKGEYPAELNIPLPFSLVNNNVHKNRLEVLPAYYWMHNLYALERNSWKSHNRDKRKHKAQHLETDYLAPDTAEEIIAALALLEGWLGEAGFSAGDMAAAAHTGESAEAEAGGIRLIPCRYLERSKRGQVIIKPLAAIAAYRHMLRYYAVKTLAVFFDSRPDLDCAGLADAFAGAPRGGAADPRGKAAGRITGWVNMGGQIVPAFRVDELRRDIGRGSIRTWDGIHSVYDAWRDEYPLDLARHAWDVLALLDARLPQTVQQPHDVPSPAGETGADGAAFSRAKFARVKFAKANFAKELAGLLETRRWISSQIYETRAKDYRNTFKRATFRGIEEMERVLGRAEDNAFVRLERTECARFEALVARILARL
jgi:NDP-sugar pyrophosphorylase family protein